MVWTGLHPTPSGTPDIFLVCPQWKEGFPRGCRKSFSQSVLIINSLSFRQFLSFSTKWSQFEILSKGCCHYIGWLIQSVNETHRLTDRQTYKRTIRQTKKPDTDRPTMAKTLPPFSPVSRRAQINTHHHGQNPRRLRKASLARTFRQFWSSSAPRSVPEDLVGGFLKVPGSVVLTIRPWRSWHAQQTAGIGKHR